MRFLIGLCFVAGCYNPSFTTCELACASGDLCPDGYRCSAGLCARGSGSCAGVADAGDDAVDSGPQGVCGDHLPNPGLACFGGQLTIDLTIASLTLHDARLLRITEDPIPDLVFAGSTTNAGNLYVAEVTPTAIMGGMPIVGGMAAPRGRFAAYDVGGDNHPELFASITNSTMLELLSHATTWAQTIRGSGIAASPAAVVVGRLGPAGAPLAIYAYPNTPSLVVIADPGIGGNTTSSGLAYVDLVVQDLDGNNIDELVGAKPTGEVEVIELTSGTPVVKPEYTSTVSATKLASASVVTSGSKDLLFLDVQGGADGVVGTLIRSGTSLQDHAHGQTGLLNVLAAADVDQDGHDDAIFARRSGSTYVLAIAFGRADGTLDPNVQEVALDGAPTYLHADVDTNQDGCKEVVITSGMKVTILLSDC